MKKKEKMLSRREKSDFKRRWGVTQEIFDIMRDVLIDWEQKNLDSRGQNSKLTSEEKIKITLTYWREYRTEFHIASDYNVSEATICRTIRRVEDALSASGQFNLTDGKRDLLDDKEDEIVIDVMECEIERPKKTEKILFRQKECRLQKGKCMISRYTSKSL